jgi:hypothetical protein
MLHRALFVATMMLAVVTGARAARADERATPPWGTIDATAAGVGRYDFRITTPPADGRLTVPPDFPQIVRATAVVADTSRDLPVELDAAMTSVAVLLPQGKGDPLPKRISVEAAEETAQFDDGRIVLTARDAQVDGTRAKLESQPGNHRIGFWTEAADAVKWTRKLSRWGVYDVALTYSTAAPDGSEVEVAIGDTKLAGRLASTGSWDRYATLPLGRVYLPTTGDIGVRVACTKKVGAAVMNLKAVVLEPACEGTPPVQGDDGVVLLHGRDATVRGTVLRYEPAEKKRTLGYWTRPSDAATWSFTVRAPGTFTIEVLQGCGSGHGGSEMAVEVDRERPDAPAAIMFTVEDTGGFQAFVPREIGSLTLAAGEHELRVAPRRIAKAAAGDIRQIRLVPAAP